jgi:hypothetical protein
MTDLERKAKREIEKYKEISVEKTNYCNQIIESNQQEFTKHMKEYDHKLTCSYEENLKKMHHVLTDRCQRYMTKCEELEKIVQDNVAVKELKAMNLTHFFEKWKLRG